MNELCIECKAGCCKGLSVEVYENYNIPIEYLIVRNKAFYMRKQKDHKTCIALDGNNLCSIYEDRPVVCRDFEINCDKCLMIQKRSKNV